jgi:NADP-dependent 3-hydroxy acid dehydrogenase YdfG
LPQASDIADAIAFAVAAPIAVNVFQHGNPAHSLQVAAG